MKNTRRYVALFCEAIDKLLPEPDEGMDATEDVLDLIMQQRRDLNAQVEAGDREADGGMFPPELMRR